MFESLIVPKTRSWKLRFALTVVAFALGSGFVSLWRMTHMPLRSYRGQLPELTSSQSELAVRLASHVRYLSDTIGERNIPHPGSLEKSADFIRKQLAAFGYSVTEQTYRVDGIAVSNLEAQLPGRDSNAGVVVVGAHYDSVEGTVGANDNASGVAAILELARSLQQTKLRRGVRFVLFVNEEPPFFQTDQMGSLVYAKRSHGEGTRVSAMISLETLGFYSDVPGSQQYPAILGLFYPSRGDFIGFVSNQESRNLVRHAVRSFRETAKFPSEGVAAPSNWPGIGWSDQWSFWQHGYPAIMVTDTAAFQYPYYHLADDTSEKIDYGRMARVVEGLKTVVTTLADQD